MGTGITKTIVNGEPTHCKVIRGERQKPSEGVRMKGVVKTAVKAMVSDRQGTRDQAGCCCSTCPLPAHLFTYSSRYYLSPSEGADRIMCTSTAYWCILTGKCLQSHAKLSIAHAEAPDLAPIQDCEAVMDREHATHSSVVETKTSGERQTRSKRGELVRRSWQLEHRRAYGAIRVRASMPVRYCTSISRSTSSLSTPTDWSRVSSATNN